MSKARDLANFISVPSVSTAEIEDNAITTAKIAAGAVIPLDLANGGQELGMRNRLINGDFSIWQRGTSRFLNWNVPQNAKYYADRWTSGQFQNASFERVDRSGTGPTSRFAMRVSSNTLGETGSVGTRMALGQMIESINCADLAGSPVTLSFWIRFSAASFPNYGGFSASIWQINSVDPVFDTTGPDAFQSLNIANGSLPTSWTRLSVTYTPTSSMRNLVARFLFDSLSATATTGQLWYEVAEVQLEAGGVATPFERRSNGIELALCQRYFYRYKYAGAMITDGWSGDVQGVYLTFRGHLPVTMRTIPATTSFGTWTFGNVHSSELGHRPSAINENTLFAGWRSASVGRVYVYSQDGTAYTDVSAEL